MGYINDHWRFVGPCRRRCRRRRKYNAEREGLSKQSRAGAHYYVMSPQRCELQFATFCYGRQPFRYHAAITVPQVRSAEYSA